MSLRSPVNSGCSISCTVAQIADAPEIAHLVNRAYRGEVSRAGWTTEADLLEGQRTDQEAISAYINDPTQVILVARPNDRPEIVGCVNLQQRADRAYLGMLTVNPLMQNSGLGKWLLTEAEIWSQANWLTKYIEMTVIHRRRELIDWYVRRGYQLTGETQAFPYGDRRFGVPIVENLDFVVLGKKL